MLSTTPSLLEMEASFTLNYNLGKEKYSFFPLECFHCFVRVLYTFPEFDFLFFFNALIMFFKTENVLSFLLSHLPACYFAVFFCYG